jgi:hypothetical protein
MSNFLQKIPVSPITSFGSPSVPNGSSIGTNFSILQVGGYMEVYSLSGLTYTIPPGTGQVEFSGNTIPIHFTKGYGSVFSPDVLTLNSDNISSGRRKLGMLAYVYETGKIYQYTIDNYQTLWDNATGATGPGGPTVVISDFGTTIKNNSPEGIAFISAWTSSTISGIGGYDDTNSSWRVLQTGGVSGVSITGGTFDHGNETLTLFNSTGGTVVVTGFTDVNVTGGTYSNGTITFTNNTGGTFNVSGLYTGTTDIFVTGGTYNNGTATFTNNTGGTFNVVGFPSSTGGTTNYYGSFSDTTNQPVSGANIPTVWKYNTTEISNGIYIQDQTKITVSHDGIYEVGYSVQIEKTQGGSATDVTIWTSVNGIPVDRSSSTTTLVSNTAYQLPFVSYILNLNAGDYVEFYFSAPSEHVQLTTLSGLTTPTRPVSPGVIIVAKAVGNAVLNNSGDTYVTGFTLTNDTLSLQQNRLGTYSGFSVNLPYLNTSGGTITGNLDVNGSLSASTYFGYGGNLTGISKGGGGAGGQLYYFNISNTQSPYYELSLSATSSSEQTISATTGGTQTAYIGGFMTPVGVPNVTSLPAGILSFYLHCYDGTTNHSFNIYCELYRRTSGGTETLLFTSDIAAVIGNTTSMVICDGFFSGITLNTSDRLVVKLYGQNISNQTRTIYFVSEGSQHYSFGITTIPSSTDTFVTGGTYSNGNITFTNNIGTTFDVSGLTTPFTGGTVSGFTNFTNGVTASTISATTYQNLPPSTPRPIYTITSNTILSDLDQVVIVNSTTATTITLPQITIDGRFITIKNINTGIETILPFSGQTIDGDTSMVIARQNVSLDFQSYNSNWYII